jgi:hypothetical protein
MYYTIIYVKVGDERLKPTLLGKVRKVSKLLAGIGSFHLRKLKSPN